MSPRELAEPASDADRPEALPRPAPGPLWPWVEARIELAMFSRPALLLDPSRVRIARRPSSASPHGIGFIALCILIWVAVLRREAPYTLLAATLTPVGPLGSVIAIEVIERKRTALS